MDPSLLSHELRNSDNLVMWCRRGIIFTSVVSIACMVVVGLYQMGVIRHIPEPPLRLLNSEKVDASAEAYSRMGLPMPDAFLGLISYAVTAALAALGGVDRSRLLPWLWVPLALVVKTAVDAVQAGRLSWEQWDVHREFCFWCLIAALATFTALPLSLPEAWGALKRLLHGLA